MNDSEDILVCGKCKKLFNELNVFVDHKSICLLSETNKSVQTSENELMFTGSIPVFNLLHLEDGTFPILLDLQYDNEEVVSHTVPFRNSSEECLTNDDAIQNLYKENLANSPLTQFLEEPLNGSQPLTENRQIENSEECVLGEKHQKDGNLADQDEYLTYHKGAVEKTILDRKKRHLCNICDYQSPYHRDLLRHMRKHTGERPFACDFCKKSFTRQDKLVIHRRIHTNDKRYRCQMCHYATTCGSSLRKHLRTHTNERPYMCQMCSYKARTASHMVIHLRTHTGDSPFFCHCGRVFKTSTDLKRHDKTHKVDVLSPTYSSYGEKCEKSDKSLSKGRKCFKKASTCYVCRDFSVKGGVKRRRSRGRRGGQGAVMCSRTYECSKCDAAFVRVDSLRSHLQLHEQHKKNEGEDLQAMEESEIEKSQTPIEAQVPNEAHVPIELDETLCCTPFYLQDTFPALDEDNIVIDGAFF